MIALAVRPALVGLQCPPGHAQGCLCIAPRKRLGQFYLRQVERVQVLLLPGQLHGLLQQLLAQLRTVRAKCGKGLVVAGAGRRPGILGCRARAAGCEQQPNEQKMYESNRFHRFLMDFCRKGTTFPAFSLGYLMEKFME